MSQARRKLIEVALPLDAINRESAREKSIRHGHPSTLHLWWARRPLAACRAVLFAQLVDDPSAHPEKFPTEQSQKVERQRLFDIMERLVVWENLADERLLREAHDEIAACFEGPLPAVLDPFAGGGSIPLEAQRLGLEAHASDLNPVPVLINKALIEIPPAWSGSSPVFPGAAASRLGAWPHATGLAEDVRRYGQWIRDRAEERIGHLYPQAILEDGTAAVVIAWIWARTVVCPNPACGATMPLARSFWLSKKKDRPVWLRAVVQARTVTFEVVSDAEGPVLDGTVGRQGAVCLVCDTPVPLSRIRTEGQEGRIGEQLLAVVAEGKRRREYLAATVQHIDAAVVPVPDDAPDTELPKQALGFRVQAYGMTHHSDLFTARQLTAMTTFSDLVRDAGTRIMQDAVVAGMTAANAKAYGDAVSLYLGLGVGRMADIANALCRWEVTKTQVRNLFGRQAISMLWDFAETFPFGSAAGGYAVSVDNLAKVIERLPASGSSVVGQADASTRDYAGLVVSTDPPYYDNIGYADLSDFFYVWLRRCLREIFPDLLGTVLTPKVDELIATPFRFGGSKAKAEAHFEAGFIRTFTQIRESHRADVPITVFYAFKQSEDDEAGSASTGWETMLTGLIEAGLAITATWPMRSELANRMRGYESNALASSILLACRPRPESAEAVNRRGFIAALQVELPKALRELQQGSVAPVDLAQAAIGPGMAVFTRYRTVVEADGAGMSVRTALALINQVLDEVLSEQEGDLNADSRFAVAWFIQHHWNEGDAGLADQLARAKNTSLEGLERGGIFRARAGKARLLGIDDLDAGWEPAKDDRISEWEVVVRVSKALAEGGIDRAAPLLGACARKIDLDNAKELAYLLFALCEKKGWTQTAILFNALGSAWGDLLNSGRLASPVVQSALTFDEDDEE